MCKQNSVSFDFDVSLNHQFFRGTVERLQWQIIICNNKSRQAAGPVKIEPFYRASHWKMERYPTVGQLKIKWSIPWSKRFHNFPLFLTKFWVQYTNLFSVNLLYVYIYIYVYTFNRHMFDDVDRYTFNHHMFDDIDNYTFNHICLMIYIYMYTVYHVIVPFYLHPTLRVMVYPLSPVSSKAP
jgi:hypothetical protein